MAEELAFEQVVGQGADRDGHERLVPALAVIVDAAGDDLLAGPGLAVDHHRSVGGRDPLRLFEEGPHDLAAPDGPVKESVIGQVQTAAQVGVLALHTRKFHPALDRQQDIVVGLDLLNIVKCPLLRRLDDIRDVGVGGVEDHHRIRIDTAHLFQNLDPVLVIGHIEIRKHQQRPLTREEADAILGIGGGDAAVLAFLEHLDQ